MWTTIWPSARRTVWSRKTLFRALRRVRCAVAASARRGGGKAPGLVPQSLHRAVGGGCAVDGAGISAGFMKKIGERMGSSAPFLLRAASCKASKNCLICQL